MSHNDTLCDLQQREAAMNRAVSRLRALIAEAIYVDVPTARPTLRVSIGSIVTCTITDSRTGRERRETWEIVGYGETYREGMRIAYNAPLARVLMGKAPGDIAESTLPAGSVEIEIVDLHESWAVARAYRREPHARR